ncbi:MAG: dihydroorotate dehydrogenase electron transfer subunit [Negativicutes bacterium]|nr:dihydroorotate dehydrogenase electron transfer subunit [Negativicutes bacterium]
MKNKAQNKAALVIENQHLKGSYWLLTLAEKSLVGLMQPGQFVNIRLNGLNDPLLRRPMSIHAFDIETGRFKVLYQVVGRGTEALTGIKAGESLQILAPLGNGFPDPAEPPDNGQQIALIAGGIGIAPLYALAEDLLRKGYCLTVYYGSRSRVDFLVLEEFQQLGVKLELATEDGSCGKQGYVTTELRENLLRKQTKAVYACGPMAMLKALKKETLGMAIPVWLSLEAHMACGLGACLGCTVRLKTAAGGWRYALICQEGPAIAAEEVEFDE